MSYADRYSGKVESVQAFRGGGYVEVVESHAGKKIKPEDLIDVLNRREFEELPEALTEVAQYESKKKYKAWDVANQIDKTKGLRRKDLKITMELMDGKRKKTVSFYTKLKRTSTASYQIFSRMNKEVGTEGVQLFGSHNVEGKHTADRKGKAVKLGKVIVEVVI